MQHAVDDKYRTKYRDLKQKVKDIELDNDRLHLKVLKTRKNIQRLRIERAILYERLSSMPNAPAAVPEPQNPHREHAFPPVARPPRRVLPPPPPTDAPPLERRPSDPYMEYRDRERGEYRDRDRTHLNGPGLPPMRTHPAPPHPSVERHHHTRPETYAHPLQHPFMPADDARGGREREYGVHDRERERDRDRDYPMHDREYTLPVPAPHSSHSSHHSSHDREREREREREYPPHEREREREYPPHERERERDYPMHDRERERDYPLHPVAPPHPHDRERERDYPPPILHPVAPPPPHVSPHLAHSHAPPTPPHRSHHDRERDRDYPPAHHERERERERDYPPPPPQYANGDHYRRSTRRKTSAMSDARLDAERRMSGDARLGDVDRRMSTSDVRMSDVEGMRVPRVQEGEAME